MSKASHRKRHSAKHAKPQNQKTSEPAERPRSRQLLIILAIAVLAGIPFSLGKYFELNFPDPYDSGSYAYSAAHILAGAKIGVDEKPSAQLGTLLVNILGVWLSGEFSETGPKVMQMLFQAAALVLMFIAMRKLFGVLPAAVGVIVASVYLSSPLIAKFGNVKEQHMIAFMVIGASCFILYQLGGKWWLAVLAGAFVSWGPLFKATGTSVIGAMGLFVIAQPFLKHRTFRQTGIDILLLLGGVVAAIGPLYLWILAWNVQIGLPYAFVWQTIGKMLPAGGAADPAKAASDYVSGGRKLIPFSDQWPKVIRFYCVLILPIALSVGAIGARILRMVASAVAPEKAEAKKYDRFVLFLAVWWLLDMAFVWISPRSYEQYYLPLTASAAMLGGYFIALYRDRWSRKPVMPTRDVLILLDFVFLAAWVIAAWLVVRVSFRYYFLYYIEDADAYARSQGYRMILTFGVVVLGLGLVGVLGDWLSRTSNKFRWGLIGVLGLVCMAIMSWHIFFGIKVSPFSGGWYPNRKERRGYVQKYDEISARVRSNGKGPWEQVGEYIRLHSEPEDKMYVWGWYPGIYVSAQRFSAASKAVMMPRPTPPVLAGMVDDLLAEFEKERPRFIVDARKRHVPMERPPYELWPIVPKGLAGMNRTWFLPVNKDVIARYDEMYSADLRKRFGDEEADRYMALAPLRKFVMENYEIVEPQLYYPVRGWQRLRHNMFYEHVLFRLKNPTPKEQM